MKKRIDQMASRGRSLLGRLGYQVRRTKAGDPNRNILRLTYGIVLLFAVLVAYEGYFLLVNREDTINNAYNNARLSLFEEKVSRGKIVSRDHEILAETDGESRNYPYGSLFAHVVGFADRGKTGLESLGNFYLLSSHVNVLEQAVRELAGRKNPGDTVVTTLDVELQKAAAEGLGGRKGAVIAMEPDTGRILAMVSNPGFDPNRMAEDWDSLISEDNREGQLLNRASQGLYPPGSVFKVVMLLEYVREHPLDYDDFRFDCDGVYEYTQGEQSYTIRCYHGTAHGSQDLNQAFANSCNGAFASMGLSMDLKKLRETADQLLFGKELPFSLEYQKSRYVMEDQADSWEILQSSIGQGRTQVTPLHMAMITSAIAHDGMLMKPRLMEAVETVDGETVRTFSSEEYGSLMLPDEAAVLRDKLALVVTDGTASVLRSDSYTAAGKTGSAEFEAGKETHAWFTGYAPADHPRLVVTVIVEEGGSGGRAAAPIAKNIFDRYFAR